MAALWRHQKTVHLNAAALWRRQKIPFEDDMYLHLDCFHAILAMCIIMMVNAGGDYTR